MGMVIFSDKQTILGLRNHHMVHDVVRVLVNDVWFPFLRIFWGVPKMRPENTDGFLQKIIQIG